MTLSYTFKGFPKESPVKDSVRHRIENVKSWFGLKPERIEVSLIRNRDTRYRCRIHVQSSKGHDLFVEKSAAHPMQSLKEALNSIRGSIDRKKSRMVHNLVRV